MPSIIPAPEDAIFCGNDSVCNKGIKPCEYAILNGVITIDHSAEAEQYTRNYSIAFDKWEDKHESKSKRCQVGY